MTLKNSFEEVKSIFTDELVNSFEKDLVFMIKNNLQSKRVFIGEYMLEDFKNQFETNSTGTRRNWRVLEDAQIETLFQTAKKRFQETTAFLEEPLVFDYDADIVVGKQDCVRIKTKFESDINDVLEQAFNKKYNRNSLQRVPKWLWVILAYFMHDNILEWMKSPLIFGLLIVFSVAIGYLYATERMHYVTNVFWMAKSLLASKGLGFGAKAEEKTDGAPNGQPRETSIRKEVPEYQ